MEIPPEVIRQLAQEHDTQELREIGELAVQLGRALMAEAQRQETKPARPV